MSPVSFYTGDVSHIRVSGPRHRLRYRIAYIALDLDRIAEADACSRYLGVERPGLMSFHACDHGDGAATDLARWVRDKAKSSGVEQECARIELLTLPRMFGYVFNPISVYFLFDATGALHHILYEVNNTFGGRHFYFAEPNSADPKLPHHAKKELYVSPFFDVEGGYEFSVRPPGDTIFLNVDYHNRDGSKALNARLDATRREVTDREALKILAGFPLMTLGVVAAIHWEALKLFFKGARFRPEPTRRTDMSGAKDRVDLAPKTQKRSVA